jgi:hypothetical protein
MLEFRSALLEAGYRKNWNVNTNDFISLYKDGVKISDTLYRIGGLSTKFGASDDYFMLLKQEEAYYADSITTTTSDDKDTSKVLVLLTKMDRKGQFNIFDYHT